jgi:aryl-alcohol dehydrogenase-like predicted oxidoreductase
MKTIQLGTSDLHVTPICLGTMTFGEQNSEADAHLQLDRALERGINFIDTAEMYPVPVKAQTQGQTERFMGTWFAKNPAKRAQVVLASKIAGLSRGATWIRGGSAPSKATISEAVDGSLKRLQTDVIDLYQIHWPSRNAPIFGSTQFDPSKEPAPADAPPSLHEMLEALAAEVKKGKIRAVGVSNETPWGVMEFCRLADLHGLPRVASVQNAYNLLNRSVENGLDEVMFRERIGLLAYSPLAFGRLTGKYDKGGFDKDGKPVGRLTIYPPTWSPRYMRPDVLRACTRYGLLAKAYGLTLTQLALAFCYQKSCVASTIIGATSIEQLDACIDAFDVTLKPEVFEQIDAIRWELRDPAQ